MKVYLCYQHVYNGCDEFSGVEKVVADEVVALMWVEAEPLSNSRWRSYKEFIVE